MFWNYFQHSYDCIKVFVSCKCVKGIYSWQNLLILFLIYVGIFLHFYQQRSWVKYRYNITLITSFTHINYMTNEMTSFPPFTCVVVAKTFAASFKNKYSKTMSRLPLQNNFRVRCYFFLWTVLPNSVKVFWKKKCKMKCLLGQHWTVVTWMGI